ncbi:MAG: hypothetical protein Q7T48_01290 [Cellvibrio sp.]|uniref:hypothetical protein n=1 Tax=Cellvibrio sp. TaxID=1965322 RepID=UPI002724327A|nr:hypothetical protein [Cellvibrio sp.]
MRCKHGWMLQIATGHIHGERVVAWMAKTACLWPQRDSWREEMVASRAEDDCR